MNKSISFKADKTFINYIRTIGFKHSYMNSECQYYYNKKHNQIRVDYKKGIISLLNSKGYVIDHSNTYIDKQINDFANKNN